MSSPAQQTDRRPRRRGAFTLVELLVVIGIIALLISILLPALNRARSQANAVKCLANLRTQGQALTMYLNQWKAYPGHAAVLSGTTAAIWPTRLRNMLNNDQGVFYCPSQLSEYEWTYTQGTGGNFATVAHSGFGYNVGEGLLNVFTVPFSYGYNDWGSYNVSGNHGLGADMEGFGTSRTPYVKIGRVRKAAEMIVIADNTPDFVWDFNIDPTTPAEAPGKIHNKGCNVLFADGHAVWYTQQDVVLYDVKTLASLGGNRYKDIARMWNNDNEP